MLLTACLRELTPRMFTYQSWLKTRSFFLHKLKEKIILMESHSWLQVRTRTQFKLGKCFLLGVCRTYFVRDCSAQQIFVVEGGCLVGKVKLFQTSNDLCTFCKTEQKIPPALMMQTLADIADLQV